MPVEIEESNSYTEAHHCAYARSVASAPIVPVSEKYIRPHSIAVNYEWRTQLGHNEWHIGNIELSGKYVHEDGTVDEQHAYGSGMVIFGMRNAPKWARDYAEANMPTSLLLTQPKTGEVSNYEQRQLDRLKIISDVERVGLKLTSDHGETHWMNVPVEIVHRIRALFGRIKD